MKSNIAFAMAAVAVSSAMAVDTDRMLRAKLNAARTLSYLHQSLPRCIKGKRNSYKPNGAFGKKKK